MKTKPELQGVGAGLVIVAMLMIATGVSVVEVVEVLLLTALLAGLFLLLVEWIIK